LQASSSTNLFLFPLLGGASSEVRSFALKFLEIIKFVPFCTSEVPRRFSFFLFGAPPVVGDGGLLAAI